MSGAEEAGAALLEATLAEYPRLKDAVGITARAVIALREADDLVLRMGRVNHLSLAAEALAAAATELHKAAEHALVSCMDATGCQAFADAGLTVSLRRNPAAVEIADEAAVPETYLTKPTPKPDRKKIGCALRAGAELNWAKLREGSLGLSRRTQSQ